MASPWASSGPPLTAMRPTCHSGAGGQKQRQVRRGREAVQSSHAKNHDHTTTHQRNTTICTTFLPWSGVVNPDNDAGFEGHSFLQNIFRGLGGVKSDTLRGPRTRRCGPGRATGRLVHGGGRAGRWGGKNDARRRGHSPGFSPQAARNLLRDPCGDTHTHTHTATHTETTKAGVWNWGSGDTHAHTEVCKKHKERKKL